MEANNQKNIPIEYIDFFQSAHDNLEETYIYHFQEYGEKLNDLNWGTTIVVALFIYISDAIINSNIVLYLNVFIFITTLLVFYLISFIIYKINSRSSIVKYVNYSGKYKDKLIHLKNLYRYNRIKDDKNLEFFADAINSANQDENKDNYLFSDQIAIEISNYRKALKKCLKIMDVTYYICLSILILFITLIPAYFIYIQFIKYTTV